MGIVGCFVGCPALQMCQRRHSLAALWALQLQKTSGQWWAFSAWLHAVLPVGCSAVQLMITSELPAVSQSRVWSKHHLPWNTLAAKATKGQPISESANLTHLKAPLALNTESPHCHLECCS